MDEELIIIEEDSKDERLDNFLAGYDDSHTRSFYQLLIKNGDCLVNGKTVKPSYKVKAGDEVFIKEIPLKEVDIEPEDIPLDILYEDSDLLIVNKPKDMVVHPAPGHEKGTLVNAVMYHCKNDLSGINGELRPGIVHRIDKDTTGSLIICKNDETHVAIAEQIKEHSVKRIYEGIIVGNPKDDTGVINGPIGRNEKDRKKMAINHKNGKDACTHYEIIERYKGYAYARFKLETGRTHQIRVHMASIGHPILGDPLYGGENKKFKTEGQVLHARIIGFIHPRSKEYIEVEAPLPTYFTHLLEVMRGL